MPRRNKRPVPEGLPVFLAPFEQPTISIRTSRIETESEHEKRLAQARQREYEQRLRRSSDECLALGECVWPGCDRPIDRSTDPANAICWEHGYDIWRQFSDAEANRQTITEHKLNRELDAMRRARRAAAEQESRVITPGWIYYARIDQRIKIGYSADVRERMRAYPPGAELLAVHPGTVTLEREMHARFRSALAGGREWFHPVADLLGHIDDVVAEFGLPGRQHLPSRGANQTIKPHRRARRNQSGQRSRG